MKQISVLAILLVLLIAAACNNTEQTTTQQPVASPWKTGIALFSFHRHPFPAAVVMSDSAGVNYVEGFSFYKMGAAYQDSTMGNPGAENIDRLKQQLSANNLQMTSMYVDGAKGLADWVRFFELGKAIGLEYLVCEPEKAHWSMIDSLAGVYQIKIAIHEHAKGISAYWHPDSVLAAINGHKNIGACADLGHWARSGLDVVDCLKKLEGHIIGLHIKDVDESGNPAAKDVNPGKGVINYPAVVAELKRQQFKGHAMIECEHELDNNLNEIKSTINYLDSLSAKN